MTKTITTNLSYSDVVWRSHTLRMKRKGLVALVSTTCSAGIYYRYIMNIIIFNVCQNVVT